MKTIEIPKIVKADFNLRINLRLLIDFSYSISRKVNSSILEPGISRNLILDAIHFKIVLKKFFFFRNNLYRVLSHKLDLPFINHLFFYNS